MISDIKDLAQLLDVPIMAATLVWALRTIESLHKDIQAILDKCLDKLD